MIKLCAPLNKYICCSKCTYVYAFQQMLLSKMTQQCIKTIFVHNNLISSFFSVEIKLVILLVLLYICTSSLFQVGPSALLYIT